MSGNPAGYCLFLGGRSIHLYLAVVRCVRCRLMSCDYAGMAHQSVAYSQFVSIHSNGLLASTTEAQEHLSGEVSIENGKRS